MLGLGSYIWRTLITIILEISIYKVFMVLIVRILMVVFNQYMWGNGGIDIKHAESNESKVSISQRP